MQPQPSASDLARWLMKVDKHGPLPPDQPELAPCWVWTASCFRGGYGSFQLGGRSRRAHILAYEWFVGPTNGLFVHHLCNNPPCVNPAHLELVTPKENIEYAARFGRMTHGKGPGLWPSGKRGVRGDNPYQQFRPAPSVETDQDRFWVKVAIPDDLDQCFRWIGGFFATGYGAFWVDGKQRRAHMVAYRWFVGEIPEGLQVCHTCDVRACVNPRHLVADTRAANMQHAVDSGRIASGDRNGMRTRPDRHWSRSGSSYRPDRAGQRNPRVRLADADVIEIRRRVATGERQKDVAREKGVSRATISMIVSRTTWTHLP